MFRYWIRTARSRSIDKRGKTERLEQSQVDGNGEVERVGDQTYVLKRCLNLTQGHLLGPIEMTH